MGGRIQMADLALGAVVWAFVGVIFGFIFVVLNEAFQGLGSRYVQYMAASAAAGAVGALMYGSMRLAVIVAAFVFVGTVTYLSLAPGAVPESLIVIAAGVGLIVGGVYGRWVAPSEIARADAKIIAGASSGLVASLLAVAVAIVEGDLSYFWLAAIVCAATGLLYIVSVRWFTSHFSNLLPPIGDGALVGAGMGTSMGLLFVVMAGTLDTPLVAQHQSLVSGVMEHVPMATVGAALGAFLAAIARSLTGARWQDL